MEFQLQHQSFNEQPGPISFRMDWLDLLAVQGALKSLLKHHSSKASILWRSAFFIVRVSHPYMTTGKTIALTRWTLVDKVMSLLFNMLSRLVITFLPRSSVQFSHSVVSNSLQPHESQHARPPCPSPSPGVHVHRVRDDIQPSHPWPSPSPPTANASQHQSLFQ